MKKKLQVLAVLAAWGAGGMNFYHQATKPNPNWGFVIVLMLCGAVATALTAWAWSRIEQTGLLTQQNWPTMSPKDNSQPQGLDRMVIRHEAATGRKRV